MPPITIRAAEPSDAATIVRLIRELAAYEDLLDRVRITEADVLRDGFGERRYFECLLAEAGGEPLGLALHRPSYSTFDGRPGLYVEDLFIAERARRLGIGRLLMARLAAIAQRRGCARMSLAVLPWNPARHSIVGSVSRRSRTGCRISSRARPLPASPHEDPERENTPRGP